MRLYYYCIFFDLQSSRHNTCNDIVVGALILILIWITNVRIKLTEFMANK